MRPDASYHDDREFDGLTLGDLELEGSVFDRCHFRECELSAASFRGSHLTECTFERCDLSGAGFIDALLHSVTFTDCRLIGVDFGAIRRDPVGLTVDFDRADLTLTTFHALDLRGCAFRSVNASEATFVECDLRGIDLTDCEFSAARFQGNDLRDADLRGSRNYALSPFENKVAGLQVDLPEALGLLLGLGVRLHQ